MKSILQNPIVDNLPGEELHHKLEALMEGIALLQDLCYTVISKKASRLCTSPRHGQGGVNALVVPL